MNICHIASGLWRTPFSCENSFARTIAVATINKVNRKWREEKSPQRKQTKQHVKITITRNAFNTSLAATSIGLIRWIITNWVKERKTIKIDDIMKIWYILSPKTLNSNTGMTVIASVWSAVKIFASNKDLLFGAKAKRIFTIPAASIVTMKIITGMLTSGLLINITPGNVIATPSDDWMPGKNSIVAVRL